MHKTWQALTQAFQDRVPRLIPSACETCLATNDASATHGTASVSVGQEGGLLLKERFLPLVNSDERATEAKLAEYFQQAFSRFKPRALREFLADGDASSAEGFVNPSFEGIMNRNFVERFLSFFPGRPLKDYNTRFFAGKAGHVSHLHFDWKSQDNLLYQISGKKVVSIYHPNRSLKLGLAGNISKKILGSVEIPPDHTFTLQAGDALFIPAFHWHEVLVLEDSASLSFRAFSDPLLGFLTDNLPPSYALVEMFDQYLSGHFEKDHLLQEVRKFCLEDTALRKEDPRSEINRLWRYGYEKYALPRLLDNNAEIERLNKAPYMNIVSFGRHLNKLWD